VGAQVQSESAVVSDAPRAFVRSFEEEAYIISSAGKPREFIG